MKTLVTKSEIRKAISEKNVQALYKMANAMGMNIFDMIRESKAGRKAKTDIFWAIECSKNVNRRWALNHKYYKTTERGEKLMLLERKFKIVNYLKEQIARPKDNYTKVAMLGMTVLYFCSPDFGHSDYNRWRTNLPIEGNEKFINKVISISNRVFGCNYKLA